MEATTTAQPTLPAPAADYETQYWATKLGLSVEAISRLTSGRTLDLAVEIQPTAPLVLLGAA